MLLLLYRRSAAHCAQRRRGGPIPRAGPPIHGAVPQLGGEFLCCALQLHHSARHFDWQFRALSLGCGSSIRRSRIRPQTCSSLRSAEMGGATSAPVAPCTQVYFTVYNRLKGTLGKRQSLPQPIVHMLSAVGAGERRCTAMHHIAQSPSLHSSTSSVLAGRCAQEAAPARGAVCTWGRLLVYTGMPLVAQHLCTAPHHDAQCCLKAALALPFSCSLSAQALMQAYLSHCPCGPLSAPAPAPEPHHIQICPPHDPIPPPVQALPRQSSPTPYGWPRRAYRPSTCPTAPQAGRSTAAPCTACTASPARRASAHSGGDWPSMLAVQLAARMLGY